MALEDAKTQVDQAFTRKEARGASFENTFGGATSFLRRRYTKELEGYDLAVTGVPFDQAVTNRTGTRLGPRAIREASALQPYDPPYGWDFDPLEELAIADYGDLAFDYAKTWEFPAALEAHAAGIIGAGAGMITRGGDHSITLPILRAIAAKHGPVALVHIDAHADVNDEMFGEKETHGTVFRRAYEEGLIQPDKVYQVGLRGSGYAATDFTEAQGWGFQLFPAHELWNRPLDKLGGEIRRDIGDRPTYVTYDIDSLDPAYAPGTGTPEIGGLTTPQALQLIRALKGIEIVGCDLVEVSPPYDPSGNTALTGANLLYELLCILPGVTPH